MAVATTEHNEQWLVTEEGAVVNATDTLPLGAVQLLAEIGDQIEGVHLQTGLSVAEAIEIVQRADVRGRDLVRDLRLRFLGKGADAKSSDQVRIWDAVSQYSSQLAFAYVDLVSLFQTYSKGWMEAENKFPVVVARAIRATSAQLSWQRMGYRKEDRDIWQTLSQLLSYVEDKDLMDAQVLSMGTRRRFSASLSGHLYLPCPRSRTCLRWKSTSQAV